MKELWIKKTIWRRYVIESGDTPIVQDMVEGDVDIEVIEEVFNINKDVEYDNEELAEPFEYEIKEPTPINKG